VNAQEKSKEEKEKELQELIIEQKKAMKDQQKTQEEAQKIFQEQKVIIDKAMEDANVGDKVNRAMRAYSDQLRNSPCSAQVNHSFLLLTFNSDILTGIPNEPHGIFQNL